MAEAKKYPEVPVEKLRWRCPPESLSFQDDPGGPGLHRCHRPGSGPEGHPPGPGGGEPGLQHLHRRPGGTGRTTTIKCLLEEIDKTGKIPDDLCLSTTLKTRISPKASPFRRGRGRLQEGPWTTSSSL